MAEASVEDWFDGQSPQRQREWLAITPPRFRIPEQLAFTVPAEYRETWLLVTYLGFGDTAASWFPAGPLAQLLIVRRAQPGGGGPASDQSRGHRVYAGEPVKARAPAVSDASTSRNEDG